MSLVESDLRANPTGEEAAVDSIVRRLLKIDGSAPWRTGIGARVYFADRRLADQQSATDQSWLVVGETDWTAADDAQPAFESMTYGHPYTASLGIEVTAFINGSDDIAVRAAVNDVRHDVKRAILANAVPLAGCDQIQIESISVDRRDPGTEQTVIIFQLQALLPECAGESRAA